MEDQENNWPSWPSVDNPRYGLIAMSSRASTVSMLWWAFQRSMLNRFWWYGLQYGENKVTNTHQLVRLRDEQRFYT